MHWYSFALHKTDLHIARMRQIVMRIQLVRTAVSLLGTPEDSERTACGRNYAAGVVQFDHAILWSRKT